MTTPEKDPAPAGTWLRSEDSEMATGQKYASLVAALLLIIAALFGVGSGYVQKVVTRRNGHCPRKLTFLDAGYRLLSN